MMRKKGFTILELIVTIAVIGILVGAIIVSFTSTTAVSEDARDVKSLIELRVPIQLYVVRNRSAGGLCEFDTVSDVVDGLKEKRGEDNVFCYASSTSNNWYIAFNRSINATQSWYIDGEKNQIIPTAVAECSGDVDNCVKSIAENDGTVQVTSSQGIFLSSSELGSDDGSADDGSGDVADDSADDADDDNEDDSSSSGGGSTPTPSDTTPPTAVVELVTAGGNYITGEFIDISATTTDETELGTTPPTLTIQAGGVAVPANRVTPSELEIAAGTTSTTLQYRYVVSSGQQGALSYSLTNVTDAAGNTDSVTGNFNNLAVNTPIKDATEYELVEVLKAANGTGNNNIINSLEIDGENNQLFVGSPRGSSGDGFVNEFSRQSNGTFDISSVINKTSPSNLGFFGDDISFHLGEAVSISPDGNTLAIGATGVDVTGITAAGRTSIFTKNSGGSWSLSQSLDVRNLLFATGCHTGGYCKFGTALEFIDDNNLLITISNTGIAEHSLVAAFERNSEDNWAHSPSSSIRTSSLSGGGVTIASLASNNLNITEDRRHQFGYNLSASSDKKTLIITAQKADAGGSRNGKVFVLKRASESSTWSVAHTISNATAVDDAGNSVALFTGTNIQFGKSAVISPDASFVVVGSSRANNKQGEVYVFSLDDSGAATYKNKIRYENASGSIFANLAELGVTYSNTKNFGFSIDLSKDGGTLYVGGNEKSGTQESYGVVYIIKAKNAPSV